MAETAAPPEAAAAAAPAASAAAKDGAVIMEGTSTTMAPPDAPHGRAPMDCVVNIKDPAGGTRAFQFTHRTTIFDALRQGISAALNIPLSAVHLNFEGALTLAATVDEPLPSDGTGGGAGGGGGGAGGDGSGGGKQQDGGAGDAAGKDGKAGGGDGGAGGGLSKSGDGGDGAGAWGGAGAGADGAAGQDAGAGKGVQGGGEGGAGVGKDGGAGGAAGSGQGSGDGAGDGSGKAKEGAAGGLARGSKSGAASSVGDSKSEGVSSPRSSPPGGSGAASMASRGSRAGSTRVVPLGADISPPGSIAGGGAGAGAGGTGAGASKDAGGTSGGGSKGPSSPGRESTQLGGTGGGQPAGGRRGSALYSQPPPGHSNLVSEDDQLSCFVQIQAVEGHDGGDGTGSGSAGGGGLLSLGKKLQFTHRGSITDALKQGLSAALAVPKEDISLRFDGGEVPESDLALTGALGRSGSGGAGGGGGSSSAGTGTTRSRGSSGSSGSLRPRSSRGRGGGGSSDGMDEDTRLDTGQLWNNEYSDSDSDLDDEWRKHRAYSHLNWLWSLGSMDNPDHARCLLRLARDGTHVTCDFAPLPRWMLDDRRPEHYAPGGEFARPGDGHFGAPYGESQLVIAEYLKKAGAGALAAKLTDKATAGGVAGAMGKTEREKQVAQEETGKCKALIVRVHKGAGEYVARRVNIDRHDEGPPRYCGGYRDKRNGAVFLNREQQTADDKPPSPKVEKFTRATQKAEVKRNFQNTIRESFTQMDRRDVLVNHAFDVVRIPGKYKDSVWWEWNRNRAAVIIQRYTRRLIAKRLAIQMRKDKQKMVEFFTEQERLEREDAKKALQHEIERRMHPETPADFDILYSELEAWRYQEVKKIHAMKLEKEEHIKAMQELLYKETKLLQKITAMKKTATEKISKACVAKKLTRMSTSKLWELTNGAVVHVTTPNTSRASDLMHLYFALAKDISSVDERMGVLGYIKWTVQEHSSDLCKEILMLIEREANFMYRGRPLKALSALRQRILNLFLMFIETPAFNPEASMFQYVHTDFDGENLQSPTRRNRPGPVAISTF